MEERESGNKREREERGEKRWMRRGELGEEEEEGEREKGGKIGKRRKSNYTEHQQHPLKFKCPSSLCLCLLHHFLELFPRQCACELLHGGNFSGCCPLQE